jgi:hypothetical protein
LIVVEPITTKPVDGIAKESRLRRLCKCKMWWLS